MTLLEYRIFHAVTQQGSFAKAAQVLHLTPSAISHAPEFDADVVQIEIIKSI